MLDNANKFILVAKMYQKMGVDSYAMVQNISTIINVNLKMYSFDHLRMYNIDHINTCCSRW